MSDSLTGIKDWSRGDLETFSQEAYEMLKYVREELNYEDRDWLMVNEVSENIIDFLTEWEMPLEDD